MRYALENIKLVQRGIQNSVKHLRWSFLQKYLTAEIR